MDPGPRRPSIDARRTRRRRLPRREARAGGTGRVGFRRPHAPRAARDPERASGAVVTVQRGAKGGAAGDVVLPRPRLRGALRRGDPRWDPASSDVPRAAARCRPARMHRSGGRRIGEGRAAQGRASRAHRGAVGGAARGQGPDAGDARHRRARHQAHESREGPLPGGWLHEGRPDPLLHRRLAVPRAGDPGPAADLEALPRRDQRNELLPEGQAGLHAEVDRELDRPQGPGWRHRLRARERSGDDRLDGELHGDRDPSVALAGRSARPPGHRDDRPRSRDRRDVGRRERSGAPRARSPSRPRPRGIPEDHRLARHPRARADRAPLHL